MTVMLWQPAIYLKKQFAVKNVVIFAKFIVKSVVKKHKVHCNFCDCVSYYICIIKMEVSACIELR